MNEGMRRGKGRPRRFDCGAVLLRALEIFWSRGYEAASIAELCRGMGINSPSLYSAFGSKEKLFLKALQYYQKAYWSGPSQRFAAEADPWRAVEDFFREAARILSLPDTPPGCMIVLAGINLSEQAQRVSEATRVLRQGTADMFEKKFRQAVADGLFLPETDIAALCGALTALLEGLSIQARDGIPRDALEDMAVHAVRILPRRLKD